MNRLEMNSLQLVKWIPPFSFMRPQWGFQHVTDVRGDVEATYDAI